MQLHYSGWRQHADVASKFSLVAALFLLPISVTGMNIAIVAAIALSGLAGEVRAKLHVSFRNPVIIAILLFLAFVLMSASYTDSSWAGAAHGVHKYGKLLLIPLLLPLLTEQKWRQYAVNAYLLAMVITLLLSYGKLFDWVSIQARYGDGTIFKNHIETSFLMSFAAFIFAQRAWSKIGWQRYGYGLLFFLALYQNYFINGGRTGYLVFAVLAALFVWQKWQWRGLLAMVIAAPIAVFGLYEYSTVFKSEIVSAHQNVQEYKQDKLNSNSIGLRLAFMKNSVTLIKEHPVLGSGLGSFFVNYNTKFGPTPDFPNGLGDPHNQYLMTSVEMGGLGLALLLFIFLQQWRYSFRLSDNLTDTAQAMLVAFAAGSTCDSFLYLSTTGYFFVLFSAVFFAAYNSIGESHATKQQNRSQYTTAIHS